MEAELVADATRTKVLGLKKAFKNKLYQTKVRTLLREEPKAKIHMVKIEKTTWEFTLELLDLTLEIYLL